MDPFNRIYPVLLAPFDHDQLDKDAGCSVHEVMGLRGFGTAIKQKHGLSHEVNGLDDWAALVWHLVGG